jgi:hypothetical protein
MWRSGAQVWRNSAIQNFSGKHRNRKEHSNKIDICISFEGLKNNQYFLCVHWGFSKFLSIDFLNCKNLSFLKFFSANTVTKWTRSRWPTTTRTYWGAAGTQQTTQWQKQNIGCQQNADTTAGTYWGVAAMLTLAGSQQHSDKSKRWDASSGGHLKVTERYFQKT